jgi:mRNA interferase RelE/StbE
LDWQIEITEDAEKLLAKMGATEAKRIVKFLKGRLQQAENPRASGDALKGTLRDYWRYRVGDYRIICRIEDNILTVFVVHVGHRREVYRAP